MNVQEGNKDWYLVAINPWHKTIFNPVTGQTKHIRYKDNNGSKP